jgi:thiol-disulfide isomerase/thioredoxin
MALSHLLVALVTLAGGAALLAQEKPKNAEPAPPPRSAQLIDAFHKVMPANPAELRQPEVRRRIVAEALPVLRSIRAYASEDSEAFGSRSLEFTVWSLVLGDASVRGELKQKGDAGDASARLLLDCSAVIEAADQKQRSAALEAVATGLRERERPASSDAASSAATCLVMAADLSADEAKALAKSTSVPALAARFTEAAELAAKDPRRLVGKPIEISGKLANGTAFSTKALLGKVVLVDFWATWCGPCVRGLPELVDAKQKHGAAGLEIVGISSDRELAALQKFLGERPEIDWLQLFEPGVPGFHPLADGFGITSIPRLFLIDKQGVLRSADARDKLDEQIGRLLAQ